jgi:hypothetical protein
MTKYAVLCYCYSVENNIHHSEILAICDTEEQAYARMEEDFNCCFEIEIGKGNIKSFSIEHYCYGEALICSNVTTIYWNIEKIEF